MKTFKDLVNLASVNWATNYVKEKINDVNDNIGDVDGVAGIPGMTIDKNEMQLEFSKISNQLSILKTFADVVAFSKSNKVDPESLMKDGFNPEKLMTMFQRNEAPSLAKMLVKIQLGGTFAAIEKNTDFIRDILDKIGREEPIENVSYDDLNYLFNRSLESDIVTLQEYLINNPKANAEVKKELNEIADKNVSWEKKMLDKNIIKLYANKIKDDVIAEGIDPTNLTEEVINNNHFEKIIKITTAVNDLSSKIDFANDLIKELNNNKKDN